MRSSHGPLKLFVGDLGDNRKSDLNHLFSKYGEISTIYVDEYKHFAFVEFTSSSAAQRALEHTHNRTVNGSKLRVEYAKSDKPSREHRRPLSRDHSPTSILYNHLQVTANRLPPMQSFRQGYYQQYPLAMPPSNPSSTSRGRSLTPPSYKQNARISTMTHLRSQDPYYQHPTMYSDPTYYRNYGDPYLMQRLPTTHGFLPLTPPPSSSSSSRSYRNMYSSSGVDRYTSEMTYRQRSRSRSRHRISQSHRDRSSREKKHKRRTSTSSSPEQKRQRGPRTPPLKTTIVQRSKKRSRSSSKAVSSASEHNSSSKSSSEDDEKEDKQSSSKTSLENSSDRKHSKARTRQ